jgi:hypothetical protein
MERTTRRLVHNPVGAELQASRWRMWSSSEDGDSFTLLSTASVFIKQAFVAMINASGTCVWRRGLETVPIVERQRSRVWPVTFNERCGGW